MRLHELVAVFLLKSGHPSVAADHLELAAFAALDLDPNDRTLAERAADALLVAGDRARRRMESRSAIDRYQRALALAGPEARWSVREARVLAGMGEAHYWLGEYPAATLALNRAVELGEAHQDAFALALALRFLGDIAINFEADVDKAERLLQRSLAAAERLGDSWAIVRSLLFAAWVPWTRERYDAAEKIWRRALESAEPRGHGAGAPAVGARGIAKSTLGRLEEAEEDVRAGVRMGEELGDRQLPPWTLRNLAKVAELRGDKVAAEELLKRSKDAESRGPH